MRVPGIYVTMQGDITSYQASLRAARRETKEAAGQMSDAMNNALVPKQLTSSYNQLIENLSQLTRAGRNARQGLKEFNVDLGKFKDVVGVSDSQWKEFQNRLVQTKDIQQAERSLTQLQRIVGLTDVELIQLAADFGGAASGATAFSRAIKSATASATRNIAVIGEALNLSQTQMAALQSRASKGINVKVKTDALRQLAQDANLSRSEVKKLEKQLGVTLNENSGISKNIGDVFGNIIKYGGVYLAINQLQELGRSAVQASIKMDQLRRTLQGVYGEQAGSQGAYLINQADLMGKNILETSRSYIKFSAAAEYAGVATESVRKIYEATSKAITKVGGSTGDVSGALVAMQQMLSKNTVSSEEFRLQFAERIPGAMKMGANAIGVTIAEFQKLMEEGEITATDFLPKLAKQMEKFASGWEEAADSVSANTERMNNQFALLSENAVNSGFVNSGAKFATSFLSTTNSLFENDDKISKLNDAFYDGSIAFDEFAKSGGLVDQVLQGMDSTLSGLHPAIRVTIEAMQRLNDYMFANDAKESVTKSLKEQERQVKRLEDRYRYLIKEFTRLASQDSGFDKATKSAKAFLDEISDVKKQVETLRGRKVDIQLNLSVDRGPLYKLQNEIADIFDKSYEAQLKKLTSNLEKAQSDLATATTYMDSLVSKRQGSTDVESRGLINSEMEKTQSVIDKATYAIGEYKSQLEDTRKEHLEATGPMADYAKAITGVDVSAQSAARQLELARQKFEALTSQAKQSYESGFITKQNLQDQLASAQAGYDDTVAGLQTKDQLFAKANSMIANRALEMIADGVGYDLYASSLRGNKINCSGFVRNTYSTIGEEVFKGSKNKASLAELKENLSGTSEAMYEHFRADNQATKKAVKGADLANMKDLGGGMILFMDATDRPWEYEDGRLRGQGYGIDHVLTTFVDDLGRLMVAQSSSSGKGVSTQTAKSYFQQYPNTDFYLANPFKNINDGAMQSVNTYQEYTEKIKALLSGLSDKAAGLTLNRFENERRQLAKTEKEYLASDEYRMASAEEQKQIVQNLEIIKLKSLEKIQAEEQKYLKEKQQAEAAAALSNATNFSDYYDAYQVFTPEINHDDMLQVFSSVMGTYSRYSEQMRDARLEMYDEIQAKAQETGDTELAIIAQVARESEVLNQLQYLQQYGSADQAFNATLSINTGAYQSELTRAREFAASEAEAISNLFFDLGDSISGSFSSIVDGLIDGTMTVEDALSELAGNVADSFMNCFNSIFQAWLQNQIGEIVQSLFGSTSLFGGGTSVLSSLGLEWGASFAQGGAVNAAGLSAYTNSVVSSPTIFPFASGTGLMGEAGPEAIMPLTRMPSGNLGVEANTGNETGEKEQKTEVTVTPKIVNVLDESTMHDAMSSRSGEQIIVNIMRKNKRALQ